MLRPMANQRKENVDASVMVAGTIPMDAEQKNRKHVQEATRASSVQYRAVTFSAAFQSPRLTYFFCDKTP